MHLRFLVILTFGWSAACGPQDPANDTSGTTESPSTSEPSTTAPTTTEPTTTEPPTTEPPTTADATSDPSTTTAGETSEPTTEGPASIACERVDGGDGLDWYMRCGGTSWESVNGYGVDGAGNVYLALDLRTLDPAPPIQLGEFEVVPGEASDIVLVKLSTDGEFLWVKHFTGPGNQYVEAMTPCGDGLAIAGSVPPGTDLGGGALADDSFIAVFDADGEHVWSRSVPILEEFGHIIVSAVACDPAGALALTGQHRGGVDLGGGPLVPNDLTDGYVARYDPDGAFAWNLGFGAIGDHNFGRAVAFAPNGDVAVVGSFGGEVDLGGGPLVADGGEDVLVARLDPAGAHLWSGRFGPDNLQYGKAVAVDAAGQVAIGGIFLLDLEIGADSYTNVFPNANEEEWGTLYDGFIAVLDPAGAPQWSAQVGSMLDDEVTSLRHDVGDRLVLTAFTDERTVIRVHDGMAPTFEWSTDQMEFRDVAPVGEDTFIVAGVAYDAVDFGAGSLAARGDTDLILARVRR